MNGTCKLCLGENRELRNSHVISEFNYAPCYDDKHRLFRISTVGPKHRRYEQKGIREYLLCQDCETKLSVWEGYAKRILNDDGLYLINQNKLGYVLGGADYKQFKLYALSLIWRMGVSTLEMFKFVLLGARHEERLRCAILEGDPLEPNEYPFILTAVTFGGKFLPDFIVPPSLARTGGHHVYRCVIGGVIYAFIIASHPLDSNMQDMALSREGVLKIPVSPVEGIPYLHDYVVQFAKAIKKAGNAGDR